MEQPTGDARSPATTTYQVGDLLVDVARAQVWRNGTEVPLPKLSFDLLLALIEASPRILSLDELMDRIWAGVVVSPETVSQRVKLLRAALGDDIRAPRYVTAVRGRGYRLVAPVAPGAVPADRPPTGRPSPDAATAPAPEPTAGKPSRRRWAALAAITVAVIVAVAAALRHVDRPAPGPVAVTTPERSVAVLPFDSVGPSDDGEVLAFGIAEAVLHQLANLPGLIVIARTSSFALGPEPGDARAIGRKLDARYLLEGSVQQDGGMLRVTAQLVDAATGTHVWSLRFDERRSHVFAVQDAIAARVAEALDLSVQASRAIEAGGRGTSNFDAYLSYLRGRTLLGTRRVSDAAPAIELFDRALQLDPAFAAAYVSLAEAEVFAAEFAAGDDRAERFEAALRRALDLLDKALALDPSAGAAYVMRGYCEAFTDLAAAEASYRRGLQLAPNDARGYAGLASVLFEEPAARGEALQLLDRARRLDPVEPAHDVTKAVFLLYDRGDVGGAEALLRNVLQRRPDYPPALARLGELKFCCRADPSEAIELLERATALDHEAQWPRRLLVRSYLDVDDVDAAARIVEQWPGPKDLLQLPVLAYRGHWRRAGVLAYAAASHQQLGAIDEGIASLALRRHARLTGQYERAIDTLAGLAGVTWRADGSAIVPPRPGLRVTGLALADVLQASGRHDAAQRLLDEQIEQMRAELESSGRAATWYWWSFSQAFALRDDPAQALDWLARGERMHIWGSDRWLLDVDPAFDGLRTRPEFEAVRQRALAHARKERAEVDALRAAGRIARGAATPPPTPVRAQ